MRQGSASGLIRDRVEPASSPAMSAMPPILLQKSKVASVRIFGEILNREAIDDSDNLSRATEVAYEFCVGYVAPQISTRKTRLRPSEILRPSAKRLLQHCPAESGSRIWLCACVNSPRPRNSTRFVKEDAATI